MAAVRDIYAEHIDRARRKATDAKSFSDHRKLLEEKGLDAILIATPDHWHSVVAIDALNSGRDVYVEKPLTLRPAEGSRIVKAARVNDRVCQVGMQQRSGKHYLEAKREYIDKGRLGKITLARTWWHGKYADKDGRTAPDTINILLEYPTDLTATFEATLVPGIKGEGIEFCGTEWRLSIDRRHYEFHAVARGSQPVIVQADDPYDLRARQ